MLVVLAATALGVCNPLKKQLSTAATVGACSSMPPEDRSVSPDRHALLLPDSSFAKLSTCMPSPVDPLPSGTPPLCVVREQSSVCGKKSGRIKSKPGSVPPAAIHLPILSRCPTTSGPFRRLGLPPQECATSVTITYPELKDS